MARIKLIQIGDTTFSSDPAGEHKSFTVSTTASGTKFFTRVRGRWHFAHPVPPSGFKVGKRVPPNVIARLP